MVREPRNKGISREELVKALKGEGDISEIANLREILSESAIELLI